MKKKQLLCLVIALCFALIVVTGCGSNDSGTSGDSTSMPTDASPGGNNTAPPPDDTVYSFNVSFHCPDFSAPEVVAAFDRIQEASNGRITMDYYFSWSLTTSPAIINDMNAGIVDIGIFSTNENQSLFPYSDLAIFTPFLGHPDMYSLGETYDEMVKEFPIINEEYTRAGLVYLTNIPLPPYHIYTTRDHGIRVPADLNGLKIITSNTVLHQIITQNGGAPLMVPFIDYATSLSTNASDGVNFHINGLRANGSYDFIKAGTLFGEQGAIIGLMSVVLSEQAWNKLPADLQQLFLNEAENIRVNQGSWDYNANKGNIDALKGSGVNLIELSSAEIQVWRDSMQALHDDFIDQLISNGSTEARIIYDAVQQKIAERS